MSCTQRFAVSISTFPSFYSTPLLLSFPPHSFLLPSFFSSPSRNLVLFFSFQFLTRCALASFPSRINNFVTCETTES